jgi:predicted AlkP superfamily phosphohydrolase/phosphomutase
VDLEELARKRTVVLMIFDGMGYELIRRWEKSATAYLASRLQGMITSVYPSTTSAAIPSIMTGKK